MKLEALFACTCAFFLMVPMAAYRSGSGTHSEVPFRYKGPGAYGAEETKGTKSEAKVEQNHMYNRAGFPTERCGNK
jgi:hypothetical protein